MKVRPRNKSNKDGRKRDQKKVREELIRLREERL